MDKCICTMREKAVGDGCEVCNPAYALEICRENNTTLLAEIEELKRERDAAKAESFAIVNGHRCGDCEDSGMLEDRSGKYPCTCITETDFWPWNEAKLEAAEAREKDLASTLKNISDIAGEPGLCNRCEQIWEIASKPPIPGNADRLREEVRREAFEEHSKS